MDIKRQFLVLHVYKNDGDLLNLLLSDLVYN